MRLDGNSAFGEDSVQSYSESGVYVIADEDYGAAWAGEVARRVRARSSAPRSSDAQERGPERLDGKPSFSFERGKSLLGPEKQRKRNRVRGGFLKSGHGRGEFYRRTRERLFPVPGAPWVPWWQLRMARSSYDRLRDGLSASVETAEFSLGQA